MKRRTIIVAAAGVAGILVVAVVLVGMTANRSMKDIERDFALVTTVDLRGIPDGIYTGSSGLLPVYARCRVRISEGKIVDIVLEQQRSGPGYTAQETVERILDAQSPLVDAVSGATTSSKSIMVAVWRALGGQN